MFDFELDEQEGFLPVFQDAFAFVRRWPKVGPQNRWHRTSVSFRGTTPWLGGAPDLDVRSVRLLHNLEHSLWDQIAAMVPRPVDRIHAVSRFFDDSPALIDRVMRDLAPTTSSCIPKTG